MRITIFQAKRINRLLAAARTTYTQLQNPELVKISHEKGLFFNVLIAAEYADIVEKSMPYFQGKIDGIKEVIDELKMDTI